MVDCLQCGNDYTNLANHWRMSSDCDYPPLSEEQVDVLTGILMGDGTIDKSGSNPRMKIEMVNKEYLEYIDGILGRMSTGVNRVMTAEENSERMRSSGFRPNAKAENYQDVYRLNTRRNPAFDKFLDWYNSGDKVIPRLELTPTIVKHWYVCDGHLMEKGGHRPRVAIGISNEYEHSDKLEQMFIEQGIDANVTKSKNLDIGADHTKKFFDFIGGPVDGFKYKWP